MDNIRIYGVLTDMIFPCRVMGGFHMVGMSDRRGEIWAGITSMPCFSSYFFGASSYAPNLIESYYAV